MGTPFCQRCKSLGRKDRRHWVCPLLAIEPEVLADPVSNLVDSVSSVSTKPVSTEVVSTDDLLTKKEARKVYMRKLMAAKRAMKNDQS